MELFPFSKIFQVIFNTGRRYIMTTFAPTSSSIFLRHRLNVCFFKKLNNKVNYVSLVPMLADF